MKLKNILIVVDNIEEAIEFYQDLFGLRVILNQDGNVIMSDGLVLQDRNIWQNFIGKDIIKENNATELYFEEKDLEAFVLKLKAYKRPIKFVNELMKHSWGQSVVRFYDPAGNLIEVGTPFDN